MEQQQSFPAKRERQVSAGSVAMIAATRDFVAAGFFASSRNSGSRLMRSQNVSQNFCSSGAAASTRPSLVG